MAAHQAAAAGGDIGTADEVGVGRLRAQKAFDAIAAYAAGRGWVSTDDAAMRAQREFPHAR